MCIIFYSLDIDSYPIILAANRDEFLARPTTTAQWHNHFNSSSSNGEVPSDTLSGLDLEGGGTWLGISIPSSTSTSSTSPLLRFATLTNYTETITPGIKPSRGNLVRDFLSLPSISTSTSSYPTSSSINSNSTGNELNDYLASIELKKHEYAGFNLLVGELNQEGIFKMGYSCNREEESILGSRILEGSNNSSSIEKGKEKEKKVIGLSNSTIRLEKGKGWPKVESGVEAFERIVKEGLLKEQDLVEGLWKVLSSSNSTPITERVHLRHTVLVRPIYFNPRSPFPPVIPTLLTTNSTTTTTTTPPLPEDLLTIPELSIEGKDGFHWYGTRVQTLLIIEKNNLIEKGWKVKFIERDAYILDEEIGKPKWSGIERKFNFEI